MFVPEKFDITILSLEILFIARTPIRKHPVRWGDENLGTGLGGGFGDAPDVLLDHDLSPLAHEDAVGEVLEDHVRQPRRERFLVERLRQDRERYQNHGQYLKGACDAPHDEVPHQGRHDGYRKDPRGPHAAQKDHATHFLPQRHGFQAQNILFGDLVHGNGDVIHVGFIFTPFQCQGTRLGIRKGTRIDETPRGTIAYNHDKKGGQVGVVGMGKVL